MNPLQALLGSRKFWVAIASLILSAAALFGLPADKSAKLAGDVTTIGGILVAAIALEDHGKSMAQANRANDDANAGDPPVTSNSPALIKALALALLMASVFFCSGCKSSVIPSQPYIAADRATFNAATPYLAKEAADHPQDAPAVSNLTASWDGRVKAAEATTQPTK